MTAIDETISLGGAGGSATACVECLTIVGLDPQLSALIAIVLGVFVRLAIDFYREKRLTKDNK
jgi:hypothetical protein